MDNNEKRKEALVVVLGDMGHSPRMQNHVLSLVRAGYFVNFIGYLDSFPQHDILSSSHVNLHRLTSAPDFNRTFPRPLSWVMRVLWQSFSLLFTLLSFPDPTFILVQNPPGVPTLPVSWMAARIKRCRLIVDWHNLGYTILALQTTSSFPVRVYKWIETSFGRRGDVHFTVSNAMKNMLKDDFAVDAHLLYDRPNQHLKPITIQEKHELFMKLAEKYDVLKGERDEPEEHITLFTRYDGLNYYNKKNRPLLVVSSTSWTEDEDFSVLLESLKKFSVKEENRKHRLFCVITGKGPLKKFYSRLIKDCSLPNVDFLLPWLEPEDYPTLLASADVGISLHTSSSGVDLPMKVVDMFGCGVPVLAYRYECIKELVHEGVNGLTFGSSTELSSQLERIVRHPDQLDKLKEGAMKEQTPDKRWFGYWDKQALPFLK